MPQKTARFIFNDVAQYDSPSSSPGLVFAIRTDARHATEALKKNIIRHLMDQPGYALGLGETERHVDHTVHNFYKIWGHDVLRAIARDLNYDLYNLTKPSSQFLHVHFYNAHDLANDTLRKAAELVKKTGVVDVPPVYISLDSMIDAEGEHRSNIEFSRVFTIDGDSHSGYTARPGSKPLDEQLNELSNRLKYMNQQYGGNVPFVLLEDNIRHAKMLNWFMGKLQEHNIFDHGKLAGISTSFCCAPETERNAIQQDGKTVPLAISVDYKDAKVDVTTPRDFLFEGFVVQVGDKTSRLPGIFMDVAKMYKIRPERADAFIKTVQRTNLEFCHNMQNEFGLTIPLSWFAGAEAVSHVTGYALDTPIVTVMRNPIRNTIPKPDTGNPQP